MKHVILYESPYEYNDFSSEDGKDGRRFYDCNGVKLPSVTTILSGTKEDNDGIKKWIERVGEEEANRIRMEAAARGTTVHHILEKQIVHGNLWDYRPETAEEKRAYKMACTIMDNSFSRINQVYGCEVSLYNPNRYAGKADVIGVFEDEPCIMDFKQTNRPKKREWIQDYLMQLAAYAAAHNILFDTEIDQGVVLMCSRDLTFQRFELTGEKFVRATNAFMKKLDDYNTSII